jgi:ABC-type glycerol-3-phosphate transport system substrate-binding protein
MSSKRVSRRGFLKLAAAGVVTAGLAACAPAATEAPPAEEPAPEEEEVEPSPVPEEEEAPKITYWGWPTQVTRSRDAEGNELIQPRILEDTGVEMELVIVDHPDYPAALKAAIPAGTGPDMLATDWDILGPYWQFMTPLNPFGEAEWGSSWKEDLYIQSALDEMELVSSLVDKSGDAVYLPGNVQLLGWLFFWIEDFDAHGIDKDALVTWADFEEAIGVLQAAGLDALTGNPHPATLVDWFQNLVEVTAPGKMVPAQQGDGKITDPEIVEAFDLFAKVHNEFMPEGILGMDSGGIQDFQSHSAVITGMFTGTPWFGFMNHEDEQVRYDIRNNWGTFQCPGSQGLASTDAGLAIVQESENKEAAWEVCKWISVGKGAEYDAKDGAQPQAAKAISVPPTGEAFDQNLGEPLFTAIKEGDNKFRRILCTDVYQTLGDVLPGVVSGQITADQAAQEVQDALDAHCEQWLPG